MEFTDREEFLWFFLTTHSFSHVEEFDVIYDYRYEIGAFINKYLSVSDNLFNIHTGRRYEHLIIGVSKNKFIDKNKFLLDMIRPKIELP